ncbi:hypothetical protein CVV38_03380 [Candidatus Peregrinibacteria bacterium HGW-Peregrinibacteria-1]|jgi:dihydrofolate reductase|nr:MAG: hypothetical protein CVV38_03380 [Candidatus Peregrinibacteria bacterium HGW-Peregrinibacteria-1]
MSSFTDKKIYAIAALDEKRGVGKDGALPWSFKKEMQYFKDTTTEVFEEGKQNMVIMGRSTWESLPEKYRPLPDRINVVLTRDRSYQASGAIVCYSLGEALKKADLDGTVETIYIVGGASVYEMALDVVDGLYITRIQKDYGCDAFFPEYETLCEPKPEFLGEEEEDGVKYGFYFYTKVLDDII